MLKKIGILYICTGKYVVFWKEFYESFERFFLPACEKHYYVFTDAEKMEHEDENNNIHRFYQASMPWPYPTLYRFKTFLRIENDLKQMDYLFFLNANAEAVKVITEDMILPRDKKGEELVVAQHPGYFDKRPYQFPYDRNPCCSAFIPYGFGKVYVAGGCNGGRTEAFLKMCHALDKRIDEDLKKDVIALWHDESHLNKYIWKHRRYRLVSPSYVYPTEEWWEIPYEPIINVRDKTKYFDVHKVKTCEVVDQTPRWANKINAIMRRIEIKWYKTWLYRGLARSGILQREFDSP